MKGVTSVKKLAAISAALVIAAAGLSGCASQSAASSAEATRENPMILSLAHGLSETHTVHIAMTEFAQNVEELTDGRIQVQIFQTASLVLRTKYGAADGRRYFYDKSLSPRTGNLQ